MMLLSKSLTTSNPLIETFNNNLTPTKSMKKQLAITAISPTVNQVVIIHQNNTITNNYGTTNVTDLISSSLSSSSSSSLGVSCVSNTINQNESNNNNNNNNDLKYSKGYVNVIKERFARRSLVNNNNSNSDIKLVEINQSNVNNPIRLSINDYQKRKQQTSNTNLNSNNTTANKVRTSSVDYQRRRSASPFTQSNNYLPKPSSNSNNNQSINNSISSASPSPLSSSYSSPISSTNTSSNNETEIIKCTYSNEINKDELPRPNFVSSVKNLFEKQINNDKKKHTNTTTTTTTSNKQQRQSLIEPVVLMNKINFKKSVSIESLVDRLKQNGTLVYDHMEKENNESILLVEQSSTPIPSHNDKKSMSFKERKEIFNNNNKTTNKPITTTIKQQNKRQKIDLQLNSDQKLTDESSDYVVQTTTTTSFNNEEDLSSISSTSSTSMSVSTTTPPNKIDEIDSNSNQSTSISANDVLNSANEKQNEKNKKSKTPVKVITFYGGQEIKDIKQLNIQHLTRTNSNKSSPQTTTTTNGNCNEEIFEFIGAGIKLNKSNIIKKRNSSRTKSSNKQLNDKRVNFMDTAETYEYPSFEFMLKEMGIDTLNDNESNGFNSFLPGKMNFNSFDDYNDNDDDKQQNEITNFNKLGSFTNFKPSWHNTDYELGSIELFEQSHSFNKQQQSQQNSSPLRLNGKNNDSFIINDILPSNDDDDGHHRHHKRWSSEMDSNILF